jgi:hypothetical protein
MGNFIARDPSAGRIAWSKRVKATFVERIRGAQSRKASALTEAVTS